MARIRLKTKLVLAISGMVFALVAMFSYLYVSHLVKTGRVMVKDEDLCLHCGLCAERCPTGAWDMQKFTIEMAQAV